MDTGAAETKVQWREWSEDAFTEAARTGRPILLALTAPWSAECRAMDAATYSEPRIAAHIEDSFIPVRVDADRRPRITERYNMGGFPSTVFLTPSGEILTGATFLGVEGFRNILTRVRETWDEQGESAGSVPRSLQDDQPPAGTVDGDIERHMVEQVVGAADEEFGGWGTDVKFPLAPTIEFALVRARPQATRTLDAIQTHLFDTYDGGFYRYANNRDWARPRREKLLDTNAALVRAFARGYRYTGDESYRETAVDAAEYLRTTLWTGEGFGASQGGNEQYFTLEATERADADSPPVDETVFADRNGLAIDGLLALVAYTDDEELARYAQRARDTVCEQLVDSWGRVTHYEDGDERGERGLLVDQARVLTGLTSSWEVLGEPGPARAVAEWTIDNLRTEQGAFRDGPTSGLGLLDRPLYPLDTTVECADALLDLAALTDDERYREIARDAVAAFAGAADRMGVEVAQYGTVASRVLEPRRVEVGAPAGSDLHRAALRLADHETVVVPDAADSDGVAPDRARLVTDGTVEGDAESPESLEALLTEAR
ncbi:DUF255 domain-containing protein [Halovenus marina]|uniref:DUF255 domain-containing protein n=1 Tax=Halovenus marina TaxID=3396621 RepID=UPI003F54812C